MKQASAPAPSKKSARGDTMESPVAPVTITVRLQPGARENRIDGFVEDRLRARVTAPPEGGRANEALLELLAEALDVPRSWVSIRRGVTSREKVVEVQGLDEVEVRRKLTAGPI